jgi:hypothetical protein
VKTVAKISATIARIAGTLEEFHDLSAYCGPPAFTCEDRGNGKMKCGIVAITVAVLGFPTVSFAVDDGAGLLTVCEELLRPPHATPDFGTRRR